LKNPLLRVFQFFEHREKSGVSVYLTLKIIENTGVSETTFSQKSSKNA
jgi:hypothetical protein